MRKIIIAAIMALMAGSTINLLINMEKLEKFNWFQNLIYNWTNHYQSIDYNIIFSKVGLAVSIAGLAFVLLKKSKAPEKLAN